MLHGPDVPHSVTIDVDTIDARTVTLLVGGNESLSMFIYRSLAL